MPCQQGSQGGADPDFAIFSNCADFCKFVKILECLIMQDTTEIDLSDGFKEAAFFPNKYPLCLLFKTICYLNFLYLFLFILEPMFNLYASITHFISASCKFRDIL